MVRNQLRSFSQIHFRVDQPSPCFLSSAAFNQRPLVDQEIGTGLRSLSSVCFDSVKSDPDPVNCHIPGIVELSTLTLY